LRSPTSRIPVDGYPLFTATRFSSNCIALAIIEVIYALGTNLVEKLTSLATALK
jgi:hypothetical protein